MRAPTLLASLLACVAGASLLAGCSSSSSSGSNGSTTTASCGSLSAPLMLTLKDVTPAAGSTVPDADIVHGFTVVNAPGLFKSVQLSPIAGKHTAGDSVPSSWTFTASQSGKDIRYEAAGVKWTHVPGHVAIEISERFQTADGCIYGLPSPLFDYDVTAAGAGGAGQGGAGGAGGAGPGGAGQGGAAGGK